MTEKRFTIQSSYLELYTIFDEKEMMPLSDNEIVDLMNRLAEENEQLKQFIRNLTTKGTHRIELIYGEVYDIRSVLND